jgi:Secretion system C-terminal sorting domain/Reeler domain
MRISGFMYILLQIINLRKSSMKKIVLPVFWITASIVALSSFTMDDEDGKAGHVGSPSEQTCSKSGCHTGFVDNTGPGSTIISSTNAELLSGIYTPGQTYTIQVTVAQNNIDLFGFGLEALNTSNQNAGTLIAGTGSQIKQANVGGVQRKCVTHTMNGGAAANTKTWSFSWTAPTGTAATTVTLYAAGNATNSDGEDTGDYVYTTSMTLEPAVSVEEKIINENSFVAYPNPTNTTLNVRFETTQSTMSFGRLYNQQGQLIKLLFAEKVGAGTHSKVLDVSDIAAGAYVLQLDAGNQSVHKQLMIQ